MSRTLWIYFLAVESKWVKIGKSSQSRGARLAQHRKPSLDGHIPDVELLCEVKAHGEDELALHRHFAHLRCGPGQEVFDAKPELLDYIRWLRDEHYVSVPEDSDEHRDALPLVEADRWMPAPGRARARDQSVLPGMQGIFDLGRREVTIDDFYTSKVIIEAARSAMGGITLDPASHAVANKVVRADRFFTISTNGLTQPWLGYVWVNPPFSKWSEWATKLLSEFDSGNAKQICALAATRTITAKYFRGVVSRCSAVCIIHGRIPFWGSRATTPDDGHAVFYFGDRADAFAVAFDDLGTVFSPIKVTVP